MSPDLERLIGRAITDKAFRDKLLADPDAVMEDFKLTDDEKQQVKKAAEATTSEQFDQQFGALKKSWS